MYFNTAYLMMLEVWHTKDHESISSDWISNFAVDDPPVSRLITYTSEEVWMGTTLVYTIAPLLPVFWRDKIIATHLVHEERIDEYTITKCFFEIHPAAIFVLAKMDGVEYSKALDELSEKALPPYSGELVKTSWFPKRSISILYLELDESLTTGLSDSPESINLMAEVLRYRLGEEGSVRLPNFVNGMMLSHGIGYGAYMIEALAVNFGRKLVKSEPGSLSLPDTVMYLWSHMACTHIYRHLGARLKRLPLYKNNANQYLNSLGSNKNTSMSKGKGKQFKLYNQLSDAYELRLALPSSW